MDKRIITIIGAKDGVGATTLAMNLALSMQRLSGAKVLLINAAYPGDLAFTIGEKGNARASKDAIELLNRSTPQMLEGALRCHPSGVGLIEKDNDEATLKDEHLRKLSEIYPYIIVDAGAVPAFPSTDIILAVSPDPLIINAAGKKLEDLARTFFPKDLTWVVVNRWSESSSIPRSCIEEKLCIAHKYWLGDLQDARDGYLKGIESLAAALIAAKRAEAVTAADIDITKIKRELLAKLQDAVDAKDVDKDTLYSKSEEALYKLISDSGLSQFTGAAKKQIMKEILDEALGLGPLEGLMADISVSEVMVNAKNEIYVERSGKIEATDLSFTSDSQMMRVIERIVAPVGRRIDESSPMVDARLADGSRVNIIIPPLSLKGPTITIRKFASKALGIEDLIKFGALSEPMAKFLAGCVKGRLNVLVSGGTGSGKTTLLNVLSSFIPANERIVTIEDAAELRLEQEHVVRLESRQANIEGKGTIGIRDLVRNSLRMRPDRIVVGECRGGEALDMLQAMNTGHDGSLTTIHANSPRDSLSRLETLVMFAGIELPSHAIREQIASAINVIVQLSRFPDGSRKITHITELSGMEGNVMTMQDIFAGNFMATGFRPRFIEKLKAKGIEVL